MRATAEAKPNGNGPEMNPFYEEGNAYLGAGVS